MAWSIALVFAFSRRCRPPQSLGKAAKLRDRATVGSTAAYPLLSNLPLRTRVAAIPARQHGMAPEQLAAIKFDVKLPN